MDFTDQEYEEMAVQVIRTYLNKDFSDDYIRKNFKFAMYRMINKAKQLEGSKPTGVKSITEGDVSMTFENASDAFVIDDEIKALLPSPYIRMY
ncbi:hypothetical protein [Clostridium peptidivorans]|uniref:hypothetical protein n=1 Tax=Clostridium peptidivorans TaxID=100174 RepID=UPI001FA820C2|nr:hypothetical protein [Clostridium peptidivorans]